MNTRTKKIASLGMLAAIAFVMVATVRIPVVLFLKYDPKDIVITLGGLIYGPLEAFYLSVIVSLIEMMTISDTGVIGLIMNVISTCSFACVAAYFYKKNHTLMGAVTGLVCGTISMVVVMVLWNYLITPIYMHVPREMVASLLIPAFLPFNALKGTLNAALTFLLYKPVIGALRKAGLIQESSNNSGKKSIGPVLVACAVLITSIVLILVLKGVI